MGQERKPLVRKGADERSWAKSSPVTDRSRPAEPATVEDALLDLQRSAGNRATTRLLTRCPGPPHPRPVQRHELASEGRIGNLAIGALTFWKDPINKNRTGEGYARMLAARVTGSLKDIGCPPPKFVYVNEPGNSDMGSFLRTTWTITLNTATFGTTMETLSEDDAAEAADTVFHEARHCNQYFRICRMLAGQGKSAKSIMKQSGIPAEIVKKAVENPLRADTAPAGMMAETSDWYNFTIGPDKGYKETASWLRGLASVARSVLVSAAFAEGDKGSVTNLVGAIPSGKKTLLKEQHRVDKVRNRSPGQALECNHLNQLVGPTATKLEDVEDAWQAAPEDDLAVYRTTMRPAVDALYQELYAAYMDYPHEADAFRSAGEVKNAFIDFAALL